MSNERAKRIAELNDQLRTTFNPAAGRITYTHGIGALEDEDRAQIFTLVKTFNNFTEENDPHGEHDFGKVEYNGHTAFFKFDCYNKSLRKGSPDPSDPSVTERVMTILLASEY